MKKRLSILIVLFIGIVIWSYYLKNTNNKEIIDNKTNNSYIDNLLVMVQDEENKYIPWNKNDWPSIDKYVFNEKLSKCENGSTIIWKEETNSVILQANISDRCYAYFDIDKKTPIEKNINRLVNLSEDMSKLEKDTEYNNKSYKGELVLHDGNIKASDGTILDAEDGGYRYSGDNPNNFVCFGPGAEGYSRDDDGATCDAKNLYRIIGIVPVEVEKEDGTTETQKLIKLIQSEYATSEQLGENASGVVKYGIENPYKDLIRIQKPNIDYSYSWNWNNALCTEIVEWKDSTLNKALNNENEGYLKYLNDINKIDWTNKIETVRWKSKNLEWSNIFRISAQKIYKEEINEKIEKPFINKIGLMYVHDYGFASSKENWNIIVSNNTNNNDGAGYDNDANRQNNWLFNGLYEWTITKLINNDRAIGVNMHGDFGAWTYCANRFGVRPTFYIKQNEIFIKGNGTAKTPYALKID